MTFKRPSSLSCQLVLATFFASIPGRDQHRGRLAGSETSPAQDYLSIGTRISVSQVSESDLRDRREDLSLAFRIAAVRACFRANRAIVRHLVGGLALDGGDDSSATLAGMFCPHRRRMRRQFATGIARRELLDRLGPAFRTIQFRIYRGWRGGWSNGGALFMLKSDLLPVLRAGTGIGAARKHQ